MRLYPQWFSSPSTSACEKPRHSPVRRRCPVKASTVAASSETRRTWWVVVSFLTEILLTDSSQVQTYRSGVEGNRTPGLRLANRFWTGQPGLSWTSLDLRDLDCGLVLGLLILGWSGSGVGREVAPAQRLCGCFGSCSLGQGRG